MTEIFLYHLDNAKGREIEALCRKLKIKYHHIAERDYLEPIGLLTGIEGFSSMGIPFTGIAFDEEMMLLKNFGNTQLDTFLAAYRQAGIAPVVLKAGLTPTNIYWNSLQLYEELSQERRALGLLNK